MKIRVYWDTDVSVQPASYIFRAHVSSYWIRLKMKYQYPPKRWHVRTSLHGVTHHRTVTSKPLRKQQI